jgi:hypothetical protein
LNNLNIVFIERSVLIEMLVGENTRLWKIKESLGKNNIND